jgi:CHASE2 domain-containing sensor protein/class 3 adenylate cyclase
MVAVVTLAVGCGVAYSAARSETGKRTEQSLLNLRWQLRAESREDRRVTMVSIPGDTLNRLEIPFPFPRGTLAEIVEELDRLGAATIVLRIDLDQPGPFRRHDTRLLRALAQSAAPVILSAVSVDAEGPRFLGGGSENRRQAGAVFGADVDVQDADGAVRRFQIASSRLDLAAVPVLAARAVEPDLRRPPSPTPWIDLPHRPCELDRAGDAVGRLPCRTPAYDVGALLQRRLPADAMRDRVVIVGVTGTEQRPVLETWAGGTDLATSLQLQAHAVGTALRGYPLRDASDTLQAAGLALVLLFPVLASAILAVRRLQTLERPRAIRSGMTVAGAGGLALAAWAATAAYAFTGHARVVDAVPALAAGLVVTLAEAVRTSIVTRRRAEDVFRTAASMAPEQVIEQIVFEQRGRRRLDAVDAEMTILFGDLQGSTKLVRVLEADAEQDANGPLAAHRTFRFINAFQELVVEVVERNNGYVQSFQGDGFMAVFGAHLHEDGTDHAARALHSARELTYWLVGELTHFCLTDRALGRGAAGRRLHAHVRKHPLGLRAGLNTGMIAFGTAGADNRYDFVTLGKATHEAAKLQVDPSASDRWRRRTRPLPQWALPAAESAPGWILDSKGPARTIVAAEETIAHAAAGKSLAAREEIMNGFFPFVYVLDKNEHRDVWVFRHSRDGDHRRVEPSDPMGADPQG